MKKAIIVLALIAVVAVSMCISKRVDSDHNQDTTEATEPPIKEELNCNKTLLKGNDVLNVNAYIVCTLPSGIVVRCFEYFGFRGDRGYIAKYLTCW